MGRPAYIKKIIQTSDPMGDLAEVSHILINLRHATKEWMEHYGAYTRTNKIYWENKADTWLAGHEKAQDAAQPDENSSETTQINQNAQDSAQ